MITNYFKQTWRSLGKNKTYSFLNILGLSAGLTCFAFISLWVIDELSYDKFNKNYDRIVRLVGVEKTEKGTYESAVSSAPMAKALKDDYAEVENTVRLRKREEIITHNGQQILQPGILLTDPSFFEVFSYNLKRGNVETALSEPYTIVLTESTAEKYFGNEDPVGKTLLLNMHDSTGYGANYTVTGVMPDPPKNAHFTFNMLASFKTIEVADPSILTVDGWGDGSFYTYALLKEGVDHKAFSKKISQFYKKYIGEMYEAWKSRYFYQLQPLKDIHLRSNLQYEIAANGNMRQVYIFSTIGIFILLLAGINYTNLATARAASRAKEVGVKKVVGAAKNQLIIQFLAEAVITAMLALLLSLLLGFLIQPFFHELTGKDLTLFSSPLLLLFLSAVTFLLGLVSGIYPAILVSAFKPAGILKGSFQTSPKGILLRRTLVVSQFVITLVLVTGIVVIYSQMSFIRKKDLGYDRNSLVFIKVNGNTDVINGFESFKNELKNNQLIAGVATSNSLPVSGLGSGGSETVDVNGAPLAVNTSRLRVDHDYLNVYGIDLLAGRNFTGKESDSVRQVIVNETAVRKFGWKSAEDAIGKPFKMGDQSGMVIGVTKNFHFNTLQEVIGPLAIYLVAERFSRITLRIDMSKASDAIAFVEQTWKKHFPSALFDYNFLDKQIAEQYAAEQRFSKIFLYFSILSLLIACLGLYGLITYTTLQRTKEIGIRKVLGASVKGIAAMLSLDFLKLVLVACVIAIPIAWYAMNKWLQDFAYRVDISWWMFAAAGILVVFIALTTVSFKVIRAALANPVKNLRTE